MSYKISLLENLLTKNNVHLQGIKRVFINNDETNSALTQFAQGVMQPGHESGIHCHATMDEYFFFIKGTATYFIDSQKIEIKPNTFVRIPAETNHNLINSGETALEFVYFGIAV